MPLAVIWIGGRKKDLQAFPEPVQKAVGIALWFAQIGRKHPHARVLSGFGGAGVVEVVEDLEGNASRAVYTITFADVVYELHCFQKKSMRGIQTPAGDIALIKARLRLAEANYEARKEPR